MGKSHLLRVIHPSNPISSHLLRPIDENDDTIFLDIPKPLYAYREPGQTATTVHVSGPIALPLSESEIIDPSALQYSPDIRLLPLLEHIDNGFCRGSRYLPTVCREIS
jgi:hypothetical protein